jgi:hypothetical protein
MFGIFLELFSSHLKLHTRYLQDIQDNMTQINLLSETAIYASVFCLSSAFVISFFKFSLTPESPSKSKSHNKKKVDTTLPNGPTPLPIVGNLFYFAKMLKNADAELIKLGEKYGALCMMWFSSNPILIVSKANDIKQLLDKVGQQLCIFPFHSVIALTISLDIRKAQSTPIDRHRAPSESRPGLGDW